MLKSDIKYLSKLLQKKYRTSEGKFIVEGRRLIEEGIKSKFNCHSIYITEEFKDNFPEFTKLINNNKIPLTILNKKDIEKISSTESPQGIAAVFEIPKNEEKIYDENVVVCLDNISDPGNVGTILRTCAWFGIKAVLLSKDCAELYNPKVLRSSMGGVFNLNIFENVDLQIEIQSLKSLNYKIYLADMNGTDYRNVNFEKKTAIIFSSEAFGPTKEIANLSDIKITIPSKGNIESLNVSAAAAIILSKI